MVSVFEWKLISLFVEELVKSAKPLFAVFFCEYAFKVKDDEVFYACRAEPSEVFFKVVKVFVEGFVSEDAWSDTSDSE